MHIQAGDDIQESLLGAATRWAKPLEALPESVSRALLHRAAFGSTAWADILPMVTTLEALLGSGGGQPALLLEH